MHRAWGTGAKWDGILHGTVGLITDDGLLLSFTVLDKGSRKTVTMPKGSARILITEENIIITEVTPDA